MRYLLLAEKRLVSGGRGADDLPLPPRPRHSRLRGRHVLRPRGRLAGVVSASGDRGISVNGFAENIGKICVAGGESGR